MEQKINWSYIKQGDEKEFERLFFAYYKNLCAYANRILRDDIESENVVQSLFCKLWDERSQIEITIGVKPYLYKAVYFSSLNMLKRKKRVEKEVELDSLNLPELQNSNLAQVYELNEAVNQAIEQLPNKRQEIFRLSRFEQKTYKEIAIMLDISIKTVENQMGKALQTLRLSLADYLPVWILLSLAKILSLFMIYNF